MSELQPLLAKFAAMGDAFLGRGPEHPQFPNPNARPAFDEFCRLFFALHQYDYTDFLRQYGGGDVDVESEGEPRWAIWLPGFRESGDRICPWNEEGYGPDPHGFLLFAHGFHQISKAEVEYGFFIDGRPGVYRTLITNRDWEGVPIKAEYVEIVRGRIGRIRYCDTFHEWLGRLIMHGELLFEGK